MRKMLLGATAIMALAAHYNDAIAFDGCPVTPQGRQCIEDVQSRVKPLGKGSKGEDLYDHWVEAKYICTPDIYITVKDAKKTTSTAGRNTNAGVYKSSVLAPDADPKEKEVILECRIGTPAELPLADKTILDKIGWVEPEAAPAPANLPKFDQDALERGCEQSKFKGQVWKPGQLEDLRESVRKENISTWSLQRLRTTASSIAGFIDSAVYDHPKMNYNQYLVCMIRARIQQLESPAKASDLNRKALLQSLPRRRGGDATALLNESVTLAKEDPATKDARVREKEEQHRRDEAVLRQASSDYVQGVVTATASQIEQSQKTSGSSGSPSPTQSAAAPPATKCMADAQLCYEIEHNLPPGSTSAPVRR